MTQAKEEAKRPFAQEAELAEKSTRLAELNSLLNMDEKDGEDTLGVDEDAAETEVADRPRQPANYAGRVAERTADNRYVKKGEKGIQIIAPAPIKEVEEREKIDKDTGLAVLNENGEPEMERVEYVVPRFRVTTVFDVSQTDGEPIPSLEVNELTASVKDYALLTATIEQVSPVPIRFDEIEGDQPRLANWGS